MTHVQLHTPCALRKLTLAIALALPAIGTPLPSSAADTSKAVTVENAKQQFNIPAQPLANALNSFIATSDWQVGFPAGLAKDVRANAVSGSYTPQQALDKLLQGTGLVYRVTGDNSVTLDKVAVVTPQSKETTLPTMIVAGKAEYDSTDPYNPDYNRPNASSATKTDAPIMETPLSIQVVPKAVMNDQQAVRVSDALKNVSGYFNSRSDQLFYDGAFLRGFQVGSRMYIDGMRNMAQPPSLVNLDRVEVVKGPAAALYGRLEPGGLINHVTKRPLSTPYYSVQQQFGSFDMYRTQVDATGPLTKSGNLAYRINMEYYDSNSFVDFIKKERIFVAPSLTWKLSDRTQLDFDYRYNEANGHAYFGIPAVGKRPAKVPISLFVGEPSDGESHLTHYAGAGLTHEFSDDWKLEAKFGYNNGYQFFNDTGIDSFDESTGIAQRGFFYDVWKENSYQGVLNLAGKFSVLHTEHTLVAGMDTFHISGEENGTYLSKSMGTTTFPADLNIYNPVYGQPGVNLALETPNSPWYESQDWWGGYVQDDMKFLDKWHLLFGTRYDQANFVSSGFPNRANPNKASDGEFSPRVGLLYQPVQWLSLYANYVKAFNGANTAKLTPGEQNQPQHSESYEAGLKGSWWDNRLTSNLAYYDLTKTNIAINSADASLANQGYKTLAGKARSRGVEFDVSGKITDDWSLIGTYTYTDTKFLRSNLSTQGHQFAGVPEHAGSLWSRYDFGSLGLNGFWSGAGVFVAGQREGDNASSFQLPGFARLDAALGYSIKAGLSKVSVQFNIDNLLDKTYFSASGNNGSRSGILPGSPRTFMGSVRVEF